MTNVHLDVVYNSTTRTASIANVRHLESPSLSQKAGRLIVRSLTGTVGAWSATALIFALRNEAIRHQTTPASSFPWGERNPQLLPLPLWGVDPFLCAGAMGILSALTTDRAMSSFWRGVQFGIVASTTTLIKGIGSGKMAEWAGQATSQMQAKVSALWSPIGTNVKEGHLSLCQWADKGILSRLMLC